MISSRTKAKEPSSNQNSENRVNTQFSGVQTIPAPGVTHAGEDLPDTLTKPEPLRKVHDHGHVLGIRVWIHTLTPDTYTNMSSDTVWNTPSIHAAEPRRAPACTGPAPHLHRISTSEVLAIAPVLHVFRTKSAPGVPTLKSTRYHIELSGFGQPKSTDTHGKYDLGTAEPDAVLYTINTEIHTKYVRIPPR